MRTACYFLLCSLLPVLPIVAQHESSLQASSASYITHVTVIDTETGKESRDQTVVISGGRIAEVKDSAEVKPAAGAKVVDGTGKYLIPGLWDMHVHRTEYESTYPMYLVNGVTGVREMAGPFDANKFRSDLAAKKLDVPRFYFASPIVDGYPPRVPDQIVVKTAEEAHKVVDQQKTNGADFIKVMDRLSRDAYFAIIDEAKRQDIPVVGHVPFAISAWEASDAGQKSIEHLHAVPLACSTREAELRARLVATKENSWKIWNPIYMEAYESYSDEKCQRLFADFKRNGTWSVPTLVVYRSTAMSGDPQFRNDDRLRYFGGQMRTWLSKNAVMERTNFDPSDFAIERQLLNRRKWLVGVLFRAGVPMLAGTDTPNRFCFPGFGLHDELALMVESGVTPLGALQAATRNPAIFLGATDKYGSVTQGKIADLVLLDADPLKDIHNTTKISEVFLGGKEFDRAALDQILKNAEQEANGSLKLSLPEAPRNPFVGIWKVVPERSHFDRTAPKDITLRFLIDKGELREEEEITLSDGSTRRTIFIPQYDGLEHPFTMSGETKHKTHAALWTRVDDRTIERRINHDNGLEYTTERLSVSPDGQTLTEIHSGKRPDGSPYETVITLQRRENVSLSYLGAAGWQIAAGNTVILVDPYLSRIRAAAAGPGMPGASEEATDARPLIGINDPLIPNTAIIDAHITKADYIFVTHSHFDHLMDVPYIAKKTGATVIGSESTTNVMRANGIGDDKLITVKGGEDYSFGSFSVRVIPSLHIALDSKHYFDSGVIPPTTAVPLRRRDLAEGGTLAFFIRIAGQRVLIFGSNNFIENEITGLRPNVLIAGPDIVPFGPPREEMYQYTTRLMRTLNCPSEVLPTHWDNFMVPYLAPQDEYVKRLQPFRQEVESACPATRFIVPKYFEPIALDPQTGGSPSSAQASGEQKLSSTEASQEASQSSAQGTNSPQPPPEMQSLAQAFEGRWSITEKYEPDEWTPIGGIGSGEEVWRHGPGGYTFMEEVHTNGPAGESFGLAVTWWDKTQNGFDSIWCINTSPRGCRVEGVGSMTWDGKQQVVQNEFPRDGKTFVWREVFTDITPTSFVQTADIGEKGWPLKRWLTIRATRIQETPMEGISKDSDEAELRAFMARLRKASIEGDVETAANSMADDYVQTDINGYRQDKSTWLHEYFKPLADLIEAGKFRWDQYDRKNLEFRFYGDCAVVTGELQAKGTGARFGPQHTWVADPNASFSGTLHFTHVYVKRNDKWLLAALHNAVPPAVAQSPALNQQIDPAFRGFWILKVEKSDFGTRPKPRMAFVNWGSTAGLLRLSLPTVGSMPMRSRPTLDALLSGCSRIIRANSRSSRHGMCDLRLEKVLLFVGSATSSCLKMAPRKQSTE